MHHLRLILWILASAVLAGCSHAPDRMETPVDKAKQLVFQKDLDGALKQCEQILAADPRDLETLLVFEEVNRKRGRNDLAIEACTRAIEVAPADPRAYRKRSDLYMAAAEAAESEDEKWRLRDLAFADLEDLKKRDPNARAALAHLRRDPPKVLQKPIPESDLPEEPFQELDAFPESIDDLAEATKDDDQRNPDDVDQDEAGSKVVETAKEYAERLAREAKEIREKELGDALEDPLLPPHSDPEPEPVVQQPITPKRPVAKLGLPIRDDGSVMLPKLGGNVATGLRPVPTESDSPNQELSGPTNRFYLQNQFGMMQQGVRTGIGSSRSVSRPTSQIWQLQAGLLPPDARSSFGPRIRQPEGAGLSRDDDKMGTDPLQPDDPSPRSGMAPNTAILTTALPGTTMLYGTNPSQKLPRYSTSREFSAAPNSPNRDGRRFGSISDPAFTPFGKRPDPSATPKLPPLGTSSN